MGMRKGVPHAKCSPLCAIKEKLQELWDRAYGCINKINDITPDGDGKFSIQAGSNIQLTEISNGLKIDTTGGVTYYTTTDPKLDIDNDALTIETVGVASQDDLDLVAGGVTTNANAISDVIDGTTTVSKATDAVNATNAQYLGSAASNVGSDLKPVKIVNGQAVAVANDLLDTTSNQTVYGGMTFWNGGRAVAIKNDLMNVYNRPASYQFGEINFIGGNDIAYIQLRATMDTNGSRRLEVNIRDISGNDHWTVLASRTD